MAKAAGGGGGGREAAFAIVHPQKIYFLNAACYWKG